MVTAINNYYVKNSNHLTLHNNDFTRSVLEGIDYAYEYSYSDRREMLLKCLHGENGYTHVHPHIYAESFAEMIIQRFKESSFFNNLTSDERIDLWDKIALHLTYKIMGFMNEFDLDHKDEVKNFIVRSCKLNAVFG